MPTVPVELPEPPKGSEWKEITNEQYSMGRAHRFEFRLFPKPPTVTYHWTGEYRIPLQEEWFKSNRKGSQPEKRTIGAWNFGERWILKRVENE